MCVTSGRAGEVPLCLQTHACVPVCLCAFVPLCLCACVPLRSAVCGLCSAPVSGSLLQKTAPCFTLFHGITPHLLGELLRAFSPLRQLLLPEAFLWGKSDQRLWKSLLSSCTCCTSACTSLWLLIGSYWTPILPTTVMSSTTRIPAKLVQCLSSLLFSSIDPLHFPAGCIEFAVG